MKHTDVEWYADGASIESAGRGRIANCAFDGLEGAWRSREEQCANAELGAAAPAMLTALIDVRDAYRVSDDETTWTAAEIDAIWARIDAIIAAAVHGGLR